jgi:hypothetical protein
MNELIGAIIAIAVISVVVNIIVGSQYVAIFSYKWALLLSVVAVAFSKLVMCLRRELDFRAVALMFVGLLIGGILISRTDVSAARTGAIILGLVFLIDLVYTIILKVSWRKVMNIPSMVANVAGDLVASGMLFYSTTRTN